MISKTTPFFKGVSINIRKIDEAIEWIPVKDIVQRARLPG